jgi:hypothetical protein
VFQSIRSGADQDHWISKLLQVLLRCEFPVDTPFYGSVFKQNEMAKNAFGFHKQRFAIALLPPVSRETESRRQSLTHQGACFPHAEKQSAATQ